MKNLIKRLLKKERFFLITYQAELTEGKGTGTIVAVTQDGRFPNQDDTISRIKKENTSIQYIAITNIIELHKKDCLDFIS